MDRGRIQGHPRSPVRETLEQARRDLHGFLKHSLDDGQTSQSVSHARCGCGRVLRSFLVTNNKKQRKILHGDKNGSFLKRFWKAMT